MKLQPYLFFGGCCAEAVEFYKHVFGAQVDALVRLKDSPAAKSADAASADQNKVMHAAFRIGDTLVLASDGEREEAGKFGGFALSVTVKDEAEAQRLFAALSDRGEVRMPLAKTFFSPGFGMLADRFGVGWMIVVEE